MQALSQLSYTPDVRNEIQFDRSLELIALKLKRVDSLSQPASIHGGVDGTRTRDPRRDRPVF
jgi:hypothetical protein